MEVFGLGKHDRVFGIYDVDELSWKFFSKRKDATKFKSEGTRRFGPCEFSFDEAIQQASNDLLALPGQFFITEDEFKALIDGVDVELSFFAPDEDNLDNSKDKWDDFQGPEQCDFHNIEEALQLLRKSCLYIWDHMNNHATELDCVIEDFVNHDGLLLYIRYLLDDYLLDIDDYEEMLEHLYDGVDDMVFDEDIDE